ncbi:ATP-binding protein [Flavobacterium muglaense]|uniref:ATP-binding protein n=1 Tax=Flavobacterium muglaense TaxID=2764716 RepID=A0A923N0P1_9FLAO|nr:ATP-binding protein [Flavobacterium muglaense]MBC5838528.1 ATP-binding protein [Flavobacterium muglaense]MBC5845062.1 ATP-binding protein [Flavobacterium muglaense]
MGDNKKLHFKTNIQLKSIIGKDLINDDNIAILELVKNSFDADAKKVEVQYFNLKKNDDKITDYFTDLTSRLIIKDNGLGMSFDEINDKWLNIAYSEKKTNNRQHNRMMAGAKGVGRFSCDRLGEFLNLYTKKQNSNDYLLLKIDWKKFEIDDNTKEIQSIELDYNLITAAELEQRNIKPFNQGVLLEIIKLRSNWVYETKDAKNWNTEKLVNLKKYLEKLINPNQAFEKNDFGIFLGAPEFIEENNKKDDHEKFIGKIENTIFEKLDFKTTSVESEIIENGKVIFTTLKDKGETIFWIKEKNSFYPEIKNIKIILYYLNTYTKSFFTKQTGVRPVDYGSIYLFFNGFRVPPYGEDGNDWLGLEQRKGQGYARFLGTRDLVGRIEILDDNNDFQIVSSREGVRRDESYKALVQSDGYFFKSFKRLEKYIVDGLSWDSSFYEKNDPKLKEIEGKIIKGDINENELIFREDDTTKKRRVYETIHSIISAKADNVIELYINEDLILNKIEEEKLNAEREFEKLILDFENKKIDGDTLNRILQKKAIENKDLEKQINDLSKYKTTDATTKAILELQLFQKTIENQTKIIEDLKNQLENERIEREKQEKLIKDLTFGKEIAETKVVEAVKEIEKKNQELTIEKLKTEFYKKQSSSETDALIHHVKNNNLQIKDAVSNIIAELNNPNLGIIEIKNLILEPLYRILQYNNKSLKAADLILQSDLEKADAQKINLPSFIEGYFQNNNFNIKINFSKTVNNFQIIGSKLDLALIFDNLIDNSKKWSSENIYIKLKIENNCGVLIFYDDGKGLDSKFTKNSDDIFKFKQTAKHEGTGFGLYLVRESLLKMNAEINIEQPINNKGMNFKMTFK